MCVESPTSDVADGEVFDQLVDMMDALPTVVDQLVAVRGCEADKVVGAVHSWDKNAALAASQWLMLVTGVSESFKTFPVTASRRCTGFVTLLSAFRTCSILLTSTTSSSDT